MTPSEAKQKIIDKVFATNDGWRRTRMDVFTGSTCHEYANEALPAVTIQAKREFGETPPPKYTFTIEAAKTVLVTQNSSLGQIAAIVVAAEKQRLQEGIAEQEGKLIEIAQKL